jgi:hypothetical protein
MSRAELRWVLIASAVVLLFASLPTLYAWRLADAEHVFTGSVYNSEDYNSYIGKMQLGAGGEWLFRLFYTAEEHQPAMAVPVHILLGKLAAGTGLSLVLTYHLARVAFGLILLVTLYAFFARFTSDVTTRRLAWALTALGSGMGWLLVLLGLSGWLGAMPLDFWVPEAFAFLVLYSLPHLALAGTLLLWSLTWALTSFEQKRLGPTWKAGVAAAGMALIVPFYAGVLAAALGAYLLALSIRSRRIPWLMVGQTALVGAFTAPIVAYNAWVFTVNPAFRQWGAQNTILSPHPLHYLLGYLPLLIPGVPGAILAVRERDNRWLLPVAWLLVVPVLLYIPFNLQRRMIAGVQVPLALLAARGLLSWVQGHTQTRRTDPAPAWPRTALAAFVALAALSNVLLVASSLVEVSRRVPPIFRPAAEIAAVDWLGGQAEPDDTVLSAFATGNVIPARTGTRVFIGHGPETLYFDEKQEAVQRFFATATDDGWRQELLVEYGIVYLFYGPVERALGDWSPAGAPYLEQVYDQDGYSIYRVREESSGEVSQP